LERRGIDDLFGTASTKRKKAAPDFSPGTEIKRSLIAA
jgi:hypothetical protein